MVRALLIAAAALGLIAGSAKAAHHARVDPTYQVRLTLDGRHLTAETRFPPLDDHFDIHDELFDQSIRGVCGTSFRAGSTRPVSAVRHWPEGARSLTFDFERDISAHARWCLIEHAGKHGGADIASVSFRRSEPYRLTGRGRSPSGQRWRLATRRSDRLEPCVSLRVADEAASQCFADDAEQEAELAVVLSVPTCPGDTFVFGAVARAAKRVAITLADGRQVDATLFPRPARSRAQAQYFLAALAGIAHVRHIEAVDGAGRTMARERFSSDIFDEPCGVLVSD